MQDSQLIDIIKTFSRDEMGELRLFVRSPYFNRTNLSEKVIALFDLIEKDYPDYSSSKLNKENVYSTIFPGEKVIEGKLDKTMSALTKVIKKFIVLPKESLEENSASFQMKMANFYREQAVEHKFYTTTQKVKNIIANTPRKNTGTYYELFKTEELLHDHETLHYNKKGDAHSVRTIRSLDEYYCAERLIMMTTLLSLRRYTTFDEAELMTMMEGIYSRVEAGDYAENLLIQSYYRATCISLYDDDKSEIKFEELLDLLDHHHHDLPLESIRNLLSCCMNYCVKQINTGNTRYNTIHFELIKKQLAAGLLYMHGGLTPSLLQNIVIMGLKLSAFDWVKTFLEAHRDRIVGSTNPKACYNFNLANYYFYLKEFDRAADLLEGNYEELGYNLRSRCLDIKICYEKKEWMMIDPKIEALKVYVLRLSKEHLDDAGKSVFLHFVNLMKRLLYASHHRNKLHCQKLLEETQQMNPLIDKEWFIEKLTPLTR